MTASVVVVDGVALQAAAAQARENSVTIAVLDDSDDASQEWEPTIGGGLEALNWLIWPTDGMQDLLESGAVRVLSADREVPPHMRERGTVTWTVTVKLTDVDALRSLATGARPEKGEEIADSLAVAWQHAVDPFVPLRSVPGISWSPGRVVVEHRPARPARSR